MLIYHINVHETKNYIIISMFVEVRWETWVTIPCKWSFVLWKAYEENHLIKNHDNWLHITSNRFPPRGCHIRCTQVGAAILHGPTENVFSTKVGTLNSNAGGWTAQHLFLHKIEENERGFPICKNVNNRESQASLPNVRTSLIGPQKCCRPITELLPFWHHNPWYTYF